MSHQEPSLTENELAGTKQVTATLVVIAGFFMLAGFFTGKLMFQPPYKPLALKSPVDALASPEIPRVESDGTNIFVTLTQREELNRQNGTLRVVLRVDKAMAGITNP